MNDIDMEKFLDISGVLPDLSISEMPDLEMDLSFFDIDLPDFDIDLDVDLSIILEDARHVVE